MNKKGLITRMAEWAERALIKRQVQSRDYLENLGRTPPSLPPEYLRFIMQTLQRSNGWQNALPAIIQNFPVGMPPGIQVRSFGEKSDQALRGDTITKLAAWNDLFLGIRKTGSVRNERIRDNLEAWQDFAGDVSTMHGLKVKYPNGNFLRGKDFHALSVEDTENVIEVSRFLTNTFERAAQQTQDPGLKAQYYKTRQFFEHRTIDQQIKLDSHHINEALSTSRDPQHISRLMRLRHNLEEAFRQNMLHTVRSHKTGHPEEWPGYAQAYQEAWGIRRPLTHEGPQQQQAPAYYQGHGHLQTNQHHTQKGSYTA